MKKTITVLSMLLAGLFAQHNAQAQYVTLPDTNFRNYIRALVPSCFNAAGDLDTVAAAVEQNNHITDFSIGGDIGGPIGYNIEGLHYFKNMSSIVVNGGTIYSLPKLPPNLNSLNFLSNQFVSISDIIVPNSVKILRFESCNLSSLPALPATLSSLGLSGNPNLNYAALPALPNTITQIDLSYNNLSTFPTAFIGQQPYLSEISVAHNQLTSLPESIFSIYVGFFYVDCSYNQLTNIPASYYEYLNCSNNQIVSLDGARISYSLECSNNSNLTCLPYLNPYVFSSLNVSGTGITCLPNKPAGLNSNLPICNPTNNPNSCPSFPFAVKGKVYKDLNNNDFYENNEPLVSCPVKVNGHSWMGYSHTEGYQIDIDTANIYNVSVAYVPAYWAAEPTSISVFFSDYGAIENQDFRLVPNQSAKDLYLYQSISTARPGFKCYASLVYENVGTVSTNVTAKFLKPAGYTVESASVSGYTVSGDTLIWNLGTLGVGQKGIVTVYGKIATNVALGTELNFESWVNQNDAQEQTLANNHSLVSETVVGSYDPNDKQARETISPAQIAAGEYIDYTIRFQNTGTDTAFSVVIADTLANTLQANTLEVVASSHNVRTSVKDNVVYFEHLNIQLPDSNVNEKESHGFVSFRIKPQANLSLGSTVSNKAAIYFDYNAPVITNTAVTKVQNPTGIFDKINKTLATYPNPVDKGILYIPNMEGASATLTSLEGKELRSWSGIGESVSLEGIAQGMYLLKVTQKGESHTAKVMVK